ncbi:hypothetical protein [Aureibacter tunicatorum]|uniref:Asp/Glu/hydantoin racemase n=1 Tax=Aureibacter tunicatorum TaxID=866807 RepID=A0AAE3XLZ9_9BACT|nr:hypothetical protein [Aureibacter tunicatorum]MDR6238424.1 hypothetical protein [Aureibacter tunicatorum]BDD03456.1 hypothetical protein AUTU_09390 [Aureibacter tunicatorum]
MIAFLHTSSIHIDRFDKLVEEVRADIPTCHYVNEKLLEDALAYGKANPDEFGELIEEIRSLEPSLIICTCSSLGELSEKYSDVHRIDLPIVEYLVQTYDKVCMAYASQSTREISAKLIQEVADRVGTKVELQICDCSKAWTYMEEGEMEQYQKTIAEVIEKENRQLLPVFLCQASMDGVEDYLESPIKLYTSPKFGV